MTLLGKLRQLADMKPGDPPPDWLPDNDWAGPISELCKQAAEEIETTTELGGRIRSGNSAAACLIAASVIYKSLGNIGLEDFLERAAMAWNEEFERP